MRLYTIHEYHVAAFEHRTTLAALDIFLRLNLSRDDVDLFLCDRNNRELEA